MLLGEETRVRRSTGEQDWFQRTRFIVVVVLTNVPAIVEFPLKSFHFGFKLFYLDLVLLTFLVRPRHQVEVQDGEAHTTGTVETAITF